MLLDVKHGACTVKCMTLQDVQADPRLFGQVVAVLITPELRSGCCNAAGKHCSVIALHMIVVRALATCCKYELCCGRFILNAHWA